MYADARLIHTADTQLIARARTCTQPSRPEPRCPFPVRARTDNTRTHTHTVTRIHTYTQNHSSAIATSSGDIATSSGVTCAITRTLEKAPVGYTNCRRDDDATEDRIHCYAEALEHVARHEANHLRDGGRTRPTRSATHAEAQEHTGTTAPRNETAIEAQCAPKRAR